jgi:hypothetical protein
LVLSASLDTSFCLYSADSCSRLFQESHCPDEYQHGWGWSACFLSDVAVKPVDADDPLWMAAFSRGSKNLPGWLDRKELKGESGKVDGSPVADRRSVLEESGESDDDRGVCMPRLPVYDDGCDDEWEHLPQASNDLGNACIHPTCGYSAVPRWAPKNEGDDRVDKDDTAGLLPRVQVGQSEDGRQYFVVGRVMCVDLYVIRKSSSGGISATLVQRLQVDEGLHGSHSEMKRIVSIVKVPKLSLLVVASHSGPVSLVRLVSRPCECCREGKKCEKSDKCNAILVIEAQLPESRLGNGDIAGVCVNEGNDDACELYVARTTGRIECFELSRIKDSRCVDVSMCIP